MKVVIAGGSGTLGRRLSAYLTAHGHEVVVLTRTPRPGLYRQVPWDGRTVGAWAEELPGSAVVNLAGALVDRRPTTANIALLTRSRTEPTEALVMAAAATEAQVPVWIQVSTTAIYGDAGEATVTEATPPADGPPQMAGVAKAWEAAAAEAQAARLVILRTSLVLDKSTPALDRLVSLSRLGLGGRIGTGRQWVSWIHIADWLAVVRQVLETGIGDSTRQVLLATGPQPVRNAELMAAVRHVVRRPWSPPTPAPLVRVGALLLRTDPALALTGRRAIPEVLLKVGFQFQHPELREALADLLSA
jgi:uncharacterized protein (TIGR01777 family)